MAGGIFFFYLIRWWCFKCILRLLRFKKVFEVAEEPPFVNCVLYNIVGFLKRHVSLKLIFLLEQLESYNMLHHVKVEDVGKIF